jgi:FkbM family methyltransferase
MAYGLIKTAARRAHLYRELRWLHRHVLDRKELERFRAECVLYGRFVRPGDLCFDVGANYGIKTEVFLALGGRVIAFEPQRDCCQELRERNPKAVVVCSAVGAALGTALMYVDQHRTGSSLLPSWRETPQTTVEVPVTTLDAAIQTYGIPGFCKVDVEGFELDVFRGLSQRIPVMSYEFTRQRIPEAVACLDYLETFGPFEANFTPRDNPTLAAATWFASREARAFLERTLPDLDGYEWGDVFVRYHT